MWHAVMRNLLNRMRSFFLPKPFEIMPWPCCDSSVRTVSVERWVEWDRISGRPWYRSLPRRHKTHKCCKSLMTHFSSDVKWRFHKWKLSQAKRRFHKWKDNDKTFYSSEHGMAHGPESELYSYQLLVMLWHWHMTVLICLFNYRINYRMRKKLNLLLWTTLDNTHVEEGVSFKTLIVIAFLRPRLLREQMGVQNFDRDCFFVCCFFVTKSFWEYTTLIMIDFAVWSWFFIFGEIYQLDMSLICLLLFWS